MKIFQITTTTMIFFIISCTILLNTSTTTARHHKKNKVLHIENTHTVHCEKKLWYQELYNNSPSIKQCVKQRMGYVPKVQWRIQPSNNPRTVSKSVNGKSIFGSAPTSSMHDLFRFRRGHHHKKQEKHYMTNIVKNDKIYDIGVEHVLQYQAEFAAKAALKAANNGNNGGNGNNGNNGGNGNGNGKGNNNNGSSKGDDDDDDDDYVPTQCTIINEIVNDNSNVNILPVPKQCPVCECEPIDAPPDNYKLEKLELKP
eukprot:Pgem_evm1s1779